MNIKNKLLTTALTASMLVPMASTSVFAATTQPSAGTSATQTTTGNTDVKYEVTEGYEWTIHSDIDFGSNAKKDNTTSVEKTNNTVEVTKNVIPNGKRLQIIINGNNGGNKTSGFGDGGFAITTSEGASLGYSVKNANVTLNNSGTVLSLGAGTNTGSVDLTFTLDLGKNSAEVAGSYTGKVIYTASVENNN